MSNQTIYVVNNVSPLYVADCIQVCEVLSESACFIQTKTQRFKKESDQRLMFDNPIEAKAELIKQARIHVEHAKKELLDAEKLLDDMKSDKMHLRNES